MNIKPKKGIWLTSDNDKSLTFWQSKPKLPTHPNEQDWWIGGGYCTDVDAWICLDSLPKRRKDWRNCRWRWTGEKWINMPWEDGE